MTDTAIKLIGTGYNDRSDPASTRESSLALSADGLTLAIGSPTTNGCYIYYRSSLQTAWSQQTNKLVGTGSTSNSNQGYSVALSADGNTLVVGACSDGVEQGACWIFNRFSSQWYQQGSKITTGQPVGHNKDIHAKGGSMFGTMVAISGDGRTIAVGAPQDNYYLETYWSGNSPIGSTWVYELTGSVWSFKQTLIGGVRDGLKSFQGVGLALSFDGKVLAVRGGCDGKYSEVFVFVRGDDNWSEQAHESFFAAEALIAASGTSISLSADGTVLAVGGYSINNAKGSTWIFRYRREQWFFETCLEYGGYSEAPRFLRALHTVKLASDGNSLVLTVAYEKKSSAVLVYRQENCSWRQQVTLIPPEQLVTCRSGSPLAIDASGTTIVVPNLSQDIIYVYSDYQPPIELIVHEFIGLPSQGASVSISRDGLLMAVGGPTDGNGLGAVWIYRMNSDGRWQQEGKKLVASDAIGYSKQGSSLAMSSNGSMLVVGGIGDNGGVGAIWLYCYSDGNWLQQVKLVGADGVGLSEQGGRVAIANNLIVTAGLSDNNRIGAVWSYHCVNNKWIPLGKKSVSCSTLSTAQLQGYGLTVSKDGSTLAIGYIMENDGRGLTRVFRRATTSSNWVFEAELVCKANGTGTGARSQGSSLCLDRVGNCLAVGGMDENGRLGATWVFKREGEKWLQDGEKLVGTGYSGISTQGCSIALSEDAGTLVVGGMLTDECIGAAWVFRRGEGGWVQLGERLVGLCCGGCSLQGCSVAVSGDGGVAVVGGSGDDGGVGAVWVYKLA